MFWGISKKFIIFTLVSIVVFISFPEIDMYISSLFYTKAEGFYLSTNPIILFIYTIPRYVVYLSIVALIIFLIDIAFKKRLFHIRPLILFYFILVMIIGPGLIVNYLLKENWGRARPVEIVDFGGANSFTPAWVPTDQCPTNCSFVSGHSGTTFSLIALALLLKRRKSLAIAAVIVLGSIVGLGRIIQGGHFFSDIFYSFIIIYLTAQILYYLIFEKNYLSRETVTS